jgi:putative tricarboxylic transport membrane protein
VLLSDRLSGLLAAALGLAVVLYARTFPPMPGQDVGPSLFPTLVGSGLIGFGGWLILADLRTSPGAWLTFAPWARRPRMVASGGLVIAALVIYILAVEPLGFFLSSILFLAVLMTAFGATRLWILPLAILVTFAMHYAFYTLLRVPLPWGPFEALAW